MEVLVTASSLVMPFKVFIMDITIAASLAAIAASLATITASLAAIAASLAAIAASLAVNMVVASWVVAFVATTALALPLNQMTIAINTYCKSLRF